jgi:D-glycero-D-manno-heptose 1,7-bisphosphate phosphatase
VDLNQSFMIGDKLIDLQCGWNAGVRRSLLVRTGYGAEVESQQSSELRDAVVLDDLPATVEWILRETK